MKLAKLLVVISSTVLITSCGLKSNEKVALETQKHIVQKVDDAVNQLQGSIASYTPVASLDHHRMAAEVGVYTPPSIAAIFSDTKVNTDLVKTNQLIGLDLPFKVLCYAEPDTTGVKVAFTSAAFVQKRHNIELGLLSDYESSINEVMETFSPGMLSKTDVTNVDEGFGIVSIKSDFDHATTVQKLRDIVNSQNDTKWFADVDFQKDALLLGEVIRPTILLLFGGPAPGGKAMMTSPKIGLDAFCQKLLVYEQENGDVWISYNDIVAFAELYYQTSTKPQQMINQRLKATFIKAVKRHIDD